MCIRDSFTFVSKGLSLETWNDHTGKETEAQQMTTPTVERAPEQAEQKKQTDPSGAKPDPGERAKLAVTDTAKPAAPGGANPAAGDSAKPDPAESEKKAADEKAKQAADEKTKQAATRRRLILMIVAGVVLIAAGLLIWKIFFAAPRIPNSIVDVYKRQAQIFGGAMIQVRRIAKTGASVLGASYLVFAVLCVPQIVAAPQIYNSLSLIHI